jgi:hypothetical protein
MVQLNIGRSIKISLSTTHLQTLASQGIPFRPVDLTIATETLGAPSPGRTLVWLMYGDQISDASLIATLQDVQVNTIDYPNGSLPLFA